MRKLVLEVEKAKIVLGSESTTVVNLESVHPVFIDTLTRSDLEDLGKDLFERLSSVSRQVLAGALLCHLPTIDIGVVR